MNLDIFLFSLITVASVLVYFFIANVANWQQRHITDFETAYWNAAQAVMWGLALSLMKGYPFPDMWAILPILPTTLIYGYIAEQPGMNFSFNVNTSLTSVQIVVLSIVSFVVLVYLGIVFYNSDKSTLFLKLIPVVLFIIWMLTWLGVNKGQSGQQVQQEFLPTIHTDRSFRPAGTETITTTNIYTFHFHHWMIGAIGFLLSINPDVISQVGSGIFWGIFCQEAAAYGISMPTDDTQSQTLIWTPFSMGPGGTRRST